MDKITFSKSQYITTFNNASLITRINISKRWIRSSQDSIFKTSQVLPHTHRLSYTKSLYNSCTVILKDFFGCMAKLPTKLRLKEAAGVLLRTLNMNKMLSMNINIQNPNVFQFPLSLKCRVWFCKRNSLPFL